LLELDGPRVIVLLFHSNEPVQILVDFENSHFIPINLLFEYPSVAQERLVPSKFTSYFVDISIFNVVLLVINHILGKVSERLPAITKFKSTSSFVLSGAVVFVNGEHVIDSLKLGKVLLQVVPFQDLDGFIEISLHFCLESAYLLLNFIQLIQYHLRIRRRTSSASKEINQQSTN
jgi:hypothetical protein